jgi:isocitrate dehydrogenase
MKAITYANGDGIGPEIMEATISILNAAGARVKWEEIKVGEEVYLSGNTSGIDSSAWESLQKNKVFLKAPITTPQGGGYKSLNVTMRKTLGLFANVRPCASFHPFVETKHPNMDVVVIRENEEDLYAGIEHRQTDEVIQCLKLVSRPGCEKIIRYSFEYAKLYGRKKVSCMVKDNIMKYTDGMFHRIFEEVSREYPEIESDSWIIDIGAARLADTPEIFDVVVTLNLYGDIISDITAQISGSIGLVGTSNIGSTCSMFEAIHGSAPDIAGKDIANPSGLLRAAVLMLNHIGQQDIAEKVNNAWSCAIEDGLHTKDIYKEGVSVACIGTKAFTEAVIKRLGKKPKKIAIAHFKKGIALKMPVYKRAKPAKKDLDGIDIFIDWKGQYPDELGSILQRVQSDLKIKMITNRGVKVWPNGFEETFCTDHWRCRFELDNKDEVVSKELIPAILYNFIELDLDVIKTENLYKFDGSRGYSLGQGQ